MGEKACLKNFGWPLVQTCPPKHNYYEVLFGEGGGVLKRISGLE